MSRSRSHSVARIATAVLLAAAVFNAPTTASAAPSRADLEHLKSQAAEFKQLNHGSLEREVHGANLAAAPDAYEGLNEDHDNTIATARPVPWGSYEERTLTDANDVDVYRFTAPEGMYVLFETLGEADTTLVIWDDDDSWVIATNDDRTTVDNWSRVGWTVPWGDGDGGPATFYVMVLGSTAHSEGSYRFYANSEMGAVVPPALDRIGGANRHVVAMNLARMAFPGWVSGDGSPVTDIVVCSGEDRAMADPLTASSLAGAYGCPVMLVTAAGVPAETFQIIDEIRNANGGAVNIHVLGGTTSVPAAVFNKLAARRGAGGIERINGATRYELAGRIADRVNQLWIQTAGQAAPLVYVANGESPLAFADALAVGPQCYNMAIPMLLTKGTTVPAETSSRIDLEFGAADVAVVNGPGFVSDGVARRVRSLDYWDDVFRITWETERQWAGAEIAQFGLNNMFTRSETLGVANKLSDALTGGTAMGALRGSVVYTDYSPLSDGAATFMWMRRGGIKDIHVLGGAASVSPGAMQEIDWIMSE